MNELEQISANATVPVYNFTSFQSVSNTIQGMMGFYNNGTRSQLQDLLRICVDFSARRTLTNITSNLNSTNLWNNTQTCELFLINLNNTYSNDIAKNFDTEFSELKDYEKNLNLLFADNFVLEKCLSLRNKLLNKTTSLQNLVELALALIATETPLEALQFAAKITESITQLRFTENEAVAIHDECSFQDSYLLGTLLWDGAVSQIESFDTTSSLMNSLNDRTEKANNHFKNFLVPHLNEILEYLSKNRSMSKGELTATFLTQSFADNVNLFKEEAQEVETYVNLLEEALRIGGEIFDRMTVAMWFPMRVITQHNIEDLFLWSSAADIEIEEVENLKQNLSNPTLTHYEFRHLVDAYTRAIFTNYTKQVTDIKKVVRGADDLHENTLILQTNLEHYGKQTQMSIDFHM